MSESGPPRPAQPEPAERPALLSYEAALKQAQDALAQSRDLAEYYDNLLKLAALESGPKTREDEAAASADITLIVMFLLAPAAFLIGMLTAKD
jgi:hypothetical protein